YATRFEKLANDNAAAVEKLKQEAIDREATVRREVEASLEEKMAEAAQKRQAAEDANVAIRAELQVTREAAETALAREKQEAAAREAAARTETALAAEAKFKDQIEEATRLLETAEATRSSTVRELEDLRSSTASTITSLQAEIATKEATARADAAAEAEASWRSRLEESDKAKQAAEAKAAEIAAARQALLDEQRAALERAKDDAVNAEKAKAFDDKLKLETKLQELTRQLQRKTADELGEGAEVRLLEDLQARFENDKFQHVGKGNAGADIIQEVIHNGKVCGRI